MDIRVISFDTEPENLAAKLWALGELNEGDNILIGLRVTQSPVIPILTMNVLPGNDGKYLGNARNAFEAMYAVLQYLHGCVRDTDEEAEAWGEDMELTLHTPPSAENLVLVLGAEDAENIFAIAMTEILLRDEEHFAGRMEDIYHYFCLGSEPRWHGKTLDIWNGLTKTILDPDVELRVKVNAAKSWLTDRQ